MVDGPRHPPDGGPRCRVARPADGLLGVVAAGRHVDVRRRHPPDEGRGAVDLGAGAQDVRETQVEDVVIDVVVAEGHDVEPPGDGPTPGG